MTRIMFVDDEPDIMYLVKKILEKEGYQVDSVYTGQECIERAGKERPDLILLDIMMPDIDGWEVSRTLKSKEETRDIPIVMLTIRTSENSVEKSFDYAYADAHIGKPINTTEMLNTIRWVLENKGRAAG
ncbi:MAG: response regulator [Methanobacteriota archaeon]|nr:MAG: response regulator [Euryarchaeota archaeon]